MKDERVAPWYDEGVSGCEVMAIATGWDEHRSRMEHLDYALHQDSPEARSA